MRDSPGVGGERLSELTLRLNTIQSRSRPTYRVVTSDMVVLGQRCPWQINGYEFDLKSCAVDVIWQDDTR
jgi:hypothetical protein